MDKMLKTGEVARLLGIHASMSPIYVTAARSSMSA